MLYNVYNFIINNCNLIESTVKFDCTHYTMCTHSLITSKLIKAHLNFRLSTQLKIYSYSSQSLESSASDIKSPPAACTVRAIIASPTLMTSPLENQLKMRYFM